MTGLEFQQEQRYMRVLSHVPRGVLVVLAEGLALFILGLVAGILSSVADVVLVGKAAFITHFALWALLNALVAIHVDSRLKAIWWAIPFNLGYMECYYISTAASYEGFGKALIVPLAGIALASPFLTYALWTAKRDRGPYGKILSILITAGVIGASYYLYGTYDLFSIVVSVILLFVLLFWPARRFKFVPTQRPVAPVTPVEASAEAEAASELGAELSELSAEQEINPSSISRSELLAEVPSIEEEESAPTLRRRRRVVDDGPLRRTRTEYGFEYAPERQSDWYQDDFARESQREREREEQTARNSRGSRSGRNGRSARDAREEREERELRRSRNRDDRISRSSSVTRDSRESRGSRTSNTRTSRASSSRTTSSARDSRELRRSRSSRDSRDSRDSLRSQRPTRRVGSDSSARSIERPSSRRYRQRHDEREREANRREATRRRAQRERTMREGTSYDSTREGMRYSERSSYSRYLENSDHSSSISTLGTVRSARPSRRAR